MIHALLVLLLLLIVFMPGMPPLADTIPQDSVTDTTDDAVRTTVLEVYGKLPILFVHNQGQLDERVEYYVKASGQTLYFTNENIVFDLIRYEQADDVDLADRNAERLTFSLDFIDANGSPVIQGGDKDTAVVNSFIGNDPEKWYTDIPTYREVVYNSIYANIDLRLYGKEGMLEYEFAVKPGANVNDIALAYTGVDSLAIEAGELVAGTAFGDIKQTRPYIYQRIADEVVEVDGNFRLAGDNAYGFEVAAYDSRYPLMIDPTLGYSTFLGAVANDGGWGIAVDSAGCAYVTGYTKAAKFPMVNSYNGTYGGNWDAFVAKFNPAGNTLAYSTFLGGGEYDRGFGIAVDSAGCAYVTGYTDSADFPMQNSYQDTHVVSPDAFVTKFTNDGQNLAYSTFLGGADNDIGYGIAVGASGCAYVTGYTDAADFPMQSPYDGTLGGTTDAFVTKFNPAGNTLAYSTYLGGAGTDRGRGTAVGGSGCAYVTGFTRSADFPTQSPYQGTWGGNEDVFVTKLGDPNITVNPTSIDFGSVAVGSSSSAQTATVTNDGCGCLTIGTITLGGPNAGQFAIQNDNCSGQTLAPGASATLQVVFSPTAVGTSATVSIPSDDPDEATVNVTLSGTGTQAAGPGVSPSPGRPAQLPPSMTTQYLAVNPQQQYVGQPVNITTNVSNTGGSTGQYTVTLMINGQVEETRLVSVGAQSALPVKFTVTRDVPGTYTVTIGMQQSSFIVLDTSGTAGSPASGGLIAIVLVGVLVLLTAVGLILVRRRRAW